MSNTSTRMIASGSAQVVRLELERSAFNRPMVGTAMILYRQFEWSTPREFRLEIGSVEVENLLRESMYRGSEVRLDVFKPDMEVGIVGKILAKLRFFVGSIKSTDVASLSLFQPLPPIVWSEQ